MFSLKYVSGNIMTHKRPQLGRKYCSCVCVCFLKYTSGKIRTHNHNWGENAAVVCHYVS
jgi:hypothetical protein